MMAEGLPICAHDDDGLGHKNGKRSRTKTSAGVWNWTPPPPAPNKKSDFDFLKNTKKQLLYIYHLCLLSLGEMEEFEIPTMEQGMDICMGFKTVI